jgi:hypothetical protein
MEHDMQTVAVRVAWIPLELKEPMNIVTVLDDNHMTETANISFFTIFCNLFSVGIKSGT